MKKIGRKKISRALRRIDWRELMLITTWASMGFYLWCRFWRII